MRCYFFTNPYYSSIQQGIQPLHAVVEMYCKYMYSKCNGIKPLEEWACKHKTVVCLNGGHHYQMAELLEFMNDDENPYSFAHFKEDEDAMGAEVLTSIGIILPEKIYEVGSMLRSRTVEFSVNSLEKFEKDTPYAVCIDEKSRERMSMAEQVKLEQTLKSYGTYSLWEIKFITEHLNKCGLAK